jgi:endonuclease G, mitochondrial
VLLEEDILKLEELGLERFADANAVAFMDAAAAVPTAALSKRLKFLTADGQRATPLEQEALLGTNDLLDVNFIDRCRLARRCVGRIRVQGPGRGGWATGFLIAPGIILTNHHVFSDAASVSTSRIGFDYWYDIAGHKPDIVDEFDFDPDRFFVSDPDLDFAVIAVAPQSRDGANIMSRKFLRLIPESGKVKAGDYVTIFQHPEGVPMQVALRENEVVRTDPNEPFIWYRADTAHGSSGAPVLNDSFQVVALHASGRIKRDGDLYVLSDGRRTAVREGLTEQEVVWEANVGFRVSRICARLLALTQSQLPAQLATIEAAMREGDIMSAMIDKVSGDGPPTPLPPPADHNRGAEKMPPSTNPDAGSTVTIPLNLQISISAGGVAAVQTPVGGTGIVEEAFEMRTPVIYDSLETRPGFKRKLLGGQVNAPMPVVTAAGREILAPLIGSAAHELKYRHFSVWMHRERRLALFTASNVDWRSRPKTVEGKSTSRDSLAGWPPNNRFAELWVDDPRMEARFQLPDGFYTDDRGAFDKGHLVRRDDVCWGSTFAEIQMANGDTFHVTNCSPQTKPFNQSAAGRENWGDLENTVAKLTAKDAQAACIYAGPIFAPDDRWFRGNVAGSPARIQIPSRYWKIVVVKEAGAFQSFGFILDQDIRAITETEFAVTAEWMAAWKPVKAIESLMRGWLDFAALKAVDQHAER